MHIPAVQTIITKNIAAYLSDKLNTKITIQGVDIRPIKSLILKDIYVEDQKTDSLLYIAELSADLGELDLENKNIHINEISLENLIGKLKTDSTDELNIQFLIDAFRSDEEKDTTAKSWMLICDRINITNSSFSYRNSIADSTDSLVNFDDLHLKGLNLTVENIVVSDTISLALKKIAFYDKSGFVLQDLSLDGVIKDNSIQANNVQILTPNSAIRLEKFAMKYNNTDDFGDFVNKVKLETSVKSSTIGSRDLAFFTYSLKGFDQQAVLSANIKGEIARLKVKELKLNYAGSTIISGNLDIEGLPDINQTFFHFDLKELKTTISDIEGIKQPPFINNKYIDLPTQMNHLGTIRYEGKLTGFLGDFVTYGEFNTNLGRISSDLAIKRDTTSKNLAFSGKINTTGFDAGKISELDSLIGNISMSSTIEGSIGSEGDFNASIDGLISSLQLKGYNYKDIKLSGLATDHMYNGTVSIDDPNLKLDFTGKVDFSNEKPVFDFETQVTNARLYKLNLDKTDSLSKVSFGMVAEITGVDPNELEAKVEISNVSYLKKEKQIDLDKVRIISLRKGDTREIKLTSDILSMNISGIFKPISLIDKSKSMFYDMFPSLSPVDADSVKIDSNNIIDFDITILDINPVLNMYVPKLQISKNSILKGHLNTATQEMQLTAGFDTIRYDNRSIAKVQTKIELRNKMLIFESESDKLSINEGMNLNNFVMNFEGYNDSLLFDIHWFNRDSLIYSGDVAALASLSRSEASQMPSVKVKMIPSEIVFANDLWAVDESTIMIDSSSIRIIDFNISHEQQFLNLHGAVTERANDSLYFIFNNINIENVNLATKRFGLQFGGILNGNANLAGIFKTPTFFTNLNIVDFNVNSTDIGDVSIFSNWDNNNEVIDLIFRLKRGSIEPFVASGSYKPKDQTIDFGVTIDRLNMLIFDSYVADYLNIKKGWLNGDLEVTGKLNDPKIAGELSAQGFSFWVNYLNTRYNFTSNFNITNEDIKFDNVRIYDENGHYSEANGIINYSDFKDIRFDINLNAEEFMFLNTTEKNNQPYYGKAIVSGLVNATGNTSDMKVDISAKTEANTVFYIPLSSNGEVGEFDFITFVNKNIEDAPPVEEEEEINRNGVQLNFELEVTPDAEVQIIFDEKVGDIIKGRGSANLKMEINTLGDFNMYGDYVIESGEYLFTLQNIVNKRFEVEKGGTIKWNGSPYDAYVDLNAIYRLKAPLYDLMVGIIDSTEFEKYKRRVRVECYLLMTQTILDPDIKFDIDVPLADDKAKSIINSLTTEELNKQLISLLILNRFYTPNSMRGMTGAQTGTAGAAGVGVTSSELLSNQLSHWLSQISNDFDIGINYRPGDDISHDELEVALSTQLFNDRVSINGNVGVSGQQQNTSGLVGDFDVNVKINKSGKLRLKAFTRSNDEMLYENSPSTQGIGLFYREDFDSLGDLFRKLRFRENRKEKKENDKKTSPDSSTE